MEPLITPSSSNHLFSETLQLQVLSDSSMNSTMLSEIFTGSGAVNVHTTAWFPIKNLAGFLLCVMGIPGNLLVVAVYSWKTSTSTRVYMLALAVADLVVCITGVVWTTVEFNSISKEIAKWCLHMSLAFSTLLLSFVSIERLMAIRRPHSFSLSPRRAKWALVVIALMGAFCAFVLSVARVKDYELLTRIFTASVTISSVVVMIGCYSVMAMTMLMKVRAAHRNTGVARGTSLHGSAPVTTVTMELNKVIPPSDFTSRKIFPESVVKSITVKLTKTYKGVSLLFIITAVFIACWMSQWLSDIGFRIPSTAKRMYILNSVVNPFIYSAVSGMFRDDVRQFCRAMRSKLASFCQ